jgi:hypothetical protein
MKGNYSGRAILKSALPQGREAFSGGLVWISTSDRRRDKYAHLQCGFGSGGNLCRRPARCD